MTSGEYIFNRRRRHHFFVDPAQEYFYKNHEMFLVSIAESREDDRAFWGLTRRT
ncbi:unnamed protein product [Acanthoscelides obtectus]|uniref:Uncharacterized protein n=1 Tax=Acanthoscelides obtectus TaxID=200917 RepID=A0A9P0KBI3_ACAOB|nr:unnamed protein product [Acanthoscelides obtectus]CAK1625602.1 hypothetical protein AOBTE_LOCUS3262 [Acanthoscelides obtectus]